MGQNADETSRSDGMLGLLASELNALTSANFEALRAFRRDEGEPGYQVAKLLRALNSLEMNVLNLRQVLIAYLLENEVSEASVSLWSKEPADQLGAAVTDWVRGLLAGAQGEAISELNTDYAEGHRHGAASAEHAKYYLNYVKRASELLALIELWECDAAHESWLPERIRKAIEHGWYVQPKRGSATQNAETSEGRTDNPPATAA
ncbi:hypothetical protein [Streptomyces sp. 8L]|uniref:hypothetical protein n=1 Tax=Streptomyces sp. 8L TaxID=2877242 RepID=UPI001CD4BF25|nr:hypothetical protein [Streptomyces sp. 8L]MCA1217126.1 hypothetical protein [Streptomyces sp. 8L]